MNDEKQATGLGGVPETMLWTLHNRARESMRRDAWLHDPEAERLYRAIDYDFERSFGKPDSSHATRSLQFDAVVSRWLERHADGVVVELGCGLETQCQRLRQAGFGQRQWLCVDVAEAIAVRERFLTADAHCRHLACSALDLRWIDVITADYPGRPVFVTFQGLLMYFPPDEVERLLKAIAARLPAVELMFDTIPPWFSRRTTSARGLWRTAHYRTPPMPWGIPWSAIEPQLRLWLGRRLRSVELQPYRRFRGFPARLMPVLARLPPLREHAPAMVHAVLTDVAPPRTAP